jgi:hypothetical protein
MGAFAAMRRVSRELGLPEALAHAVGEKDAGLLLDLAFYSVVTEGNVAQHYPAYVWSHPLITAGMRIYSDSRVSEALHAAGGDTPSGFLREWNEGRDRRERIWISYDSANVSCQAGDISFVEPGHPKDGKGLPVMNLSIAYDRTNSAPLFYEEYPGSIVDVSQLQLMAEKAQAFGWRRYGFILDRGYFSRASIGCMDRHGYPFMMMVKGMSRLVSETVSEVRGTFETSRACSIRRYRAYGTTVRRLLWSGDSRERWIHIYHSSAREAREREALEAQLERMAAAMSRMEGRKWSMPAEYSRWYEAYCDGETFLFAKERQDAVREALEHCGYFAIVTSEEMDARAALMLYKSRDASEKLFCASKSFLGGDALRVHSDESASGKVFCGFVALIIRDRMHALLSQHAASAGSKANYMSVPAAIRELEKIELIRQADGVYRLAHAVTATQKAILAAFGMDAGDMAEAAKEISGTIGEGR